MTRFRFLKFPSSMASEVSSQAGEFLEFDNLRFRQEAALCSYSQRGPLEKKFRYNVHPGLPVALERATV